MTAVVAALRSRFGLEGSVHEGAVTFAVAEGERFVPRLFAELGVAIRSVSVARPTLDDVFMGAKWRRRPRRVSEREPQLGIAVRQPLEWPLGQSGPGRVTAQPLAALGGRVR